MEIVFLIVGVAIGAALAFFFVKSKGDNGLGAQLSAATEKGRLLESNVAELKNELRLANESSEIKLNSEKNTIAKLNGELAAAQTDNNNLHQRLLEQKAEIEDLNKRFTKEFENLANRILDEKSQKFTDQNKNNLDIILNPFKEKLKEFEQKVDHAYKTESNERITLKTEIKNLIDLNKQISEEANNLATALKGDNKQQGNWGELVLEKILERSGLVEGEGYRTQFTANNANGEKIRPDVVVMLPDNKHIIIDSKVSLVAYEACVNAATPEDRARFLKAHVESLRSHVKLLSDKGYQTATGIDTPDFVLLFVPIESSFSLAVQSDNELFNFAWDRKVVIVSPSTLLATLRTIASIWKQERQTRNALEIAEEGGKLYDKFVSFYEDLLAIGKKMDGAKSDYTEAMKKLYDGTGNLVRRAEKMRELGAKTNKQLPQNIIDRALE
ncbi:MAG: DNA recombination protein RmuC [Bacteroidetes bacterium]|nr:DNA recombination protein RmuC [Bacteroidota bacterium]